MPKASLGPTVRKLRHREDALFGMHFASKCQCHLYDPYTDEIAEPCEVAQAITRTRRQIRLISDVRRDNLARRWKNRKQKGLARCAA